MNKEKIFAGIDVSKNHLDLALSANGQVERYLNDETGIELLVENLKGIQSGLIVLEATGGLEMLADHPSQWCQRQTGARLCQSDR